MIIVGAVSLIMSVSGRERCKLERWGSKLLDDTVPRGCRRVDVCILKSPSDICINEDSIKRLWPTDIREWIDMTHPWMSMPGNLRESSAPFVEITLDFHIVFTYSSVEQHIWTRHMWRIIPIQCAGQTERCVYSASPPRTHGSHMPS